MERHFQKFAKRRQLVWYTQIFENFVLKVFFLFNFARVFFGTFGWMVRITEIRLLLDFLEIFPRIFVPFATISKFSKVSVEWKVPLYFSHILWH